LSIFVIDEEIKCDKSIDIIFLEFGSNSPLKKFSRLSIVFAKCISIDLFASIIKGSSPKIIDS